MFVKSAVLLALFTAAGKVAAATTPACLIAAFNTQSNPSDLSAVCSTGASSVEAYIASNCGSSASDALTAFQSSCAAVGASFAITNATVTTSSNVTASANVSVLAAAVTTIPVSTSGGVITITSTFWDAECTCTRTSAVVSAAAITSFSTSSVALVTAAAVTNATLAATARSTTSTSTAGATSVYAAATSVYTGAAAPKADGVSLAAAAIAVAGVMFAL